MKSGVANATPFCYNREHKCEKEVCTMNRKEFKEGIRDGFPICLGYISVSMAFGLTAVKSGMPIWSAILISLTNLTSAGQLAGTNLLLAQSSYIELMITTFIINIRYFLMSLSLSAAYLNICIPLSSPESGLSMKNQICLFFKKGYPSI